MNNILLSFDLEEFDIPEEYGQRVSAADQLARSREGLLLLLVLLKRMHIRATFYTTAVFAGAHKELIREMARTHEIASHSYAHSSFRDEDIALSKNVLEEITGKPVTGYRSPRLAPVAEKLLTDAGYRYQSSLNPAWVPGRYNNRDKPRLPFRTSLINLPSSVTRLLRLPLFWISFKVFPYGFYKRSCIQLLRKEHFLHLYFHPWEFTDLNGFKMPWYTRKPDGAVLLKRFEHLLQSLGKEGEFILSSDYCDQFEKGE
ncbi:MAG TPA: polysaccharide deacetylase family protein [Bacteroidia bacterium]|nr:polysaccharide deacetylase family protein [Bacteroidia bacterium]